MKKNSRKRIRVFKYLKRRKEYFLIGVFDFNETPKCSWLGGFDVPDDILNDKDVKVKNGPSYNLNGTKYISKPKISNILTEEDKKKD